MTNEDKDKKEYELALLLKNEEDIASVVTLVGQHNGEGISEPRAKRLQLAYEIKKVNEAVFVYFTFKMFGDDMNQLEHDLNTRADVLRSMVIASPAPAERPSSPMMSHDRRTPSSRPATTRTFNSEAKPAAAPRSLSNEALEKKIEEILQ